MSTPDSVKNIGVRQLYNIHNNSSNINIILKTNMHKTINFIIIYFY